MTKFKMYGGITINSSLATRLDRVLFKKAVNMTLEVSVRIKEKKIIEKEYARKSPPPLKLLLNIFSSTLTFIFRLTQKYQ